MGQEGIEPGTEGLNAKQPARFPGQAVCFSDRMLFRVDRLNGANISAGAAVGANLRINHIEVPFRNSFYRHSLMQVPQAVQSVSLILCAILSRLKVNQYAKVSIFLRKGTSVAIFFLFSEVLRVGG